MTNAREVVNVRKFKAGYEIREELVSMNDVDPPMLMKNAYTPDGHYIGSSRWAHRLTVGRGIKPELLDGCDSNVCSIGFSEREQKWYGWSHRAIYGFSVGYVAKEGHVVTESGWIDEYLEEHPEADRSVAVGFEAKTLDACKLLAIAYADAVG